jgi:hypothetical protein
MASGALYRLARWRVRGFDERAYSVELELPRSRGQLSPLFWRKRAGGEPIPIRSFI